MWYMCVVRTPGAWCITITLLLLCIVQGSKQHYIQPELPGHHELIITSMARAIKNLENIITDKLASVDNRLTQIDNKLIEIQQSVDNNKLSQGCPDGFIKSNGSKQCFKIFKDKKRTWEDAKDKCHSERLLLAEPSDSVAVTLRKDIYDKYGSGSFVWLGARGAGSQFIWQSNSEQISGSLWHPRYAGTGSRATNSYCLLLLAHDSDLKRHPTQPYYAQTCSYTNYPLCELAME